MSSQEPLCGSTDEHASSAMFPRACRSWYGADPLGSMVGYFDLPKPRFIPPPIERVHTNTKPPPRIFFKKRTREETLAMRMGIQRAWEEGKSLSDISRLFQCSHDTAARWKPGRDLNPDGIVSRYRERILAMASAHPEMRMIEIAKVIGCHVQTVAKWIQESRRQDPGATDRCA